MIQVRILVSSCVLFAALAHPAFGGERGFEFTGIVKNSFSGPWGIPIPVNSLVTGRFVFETNIAATYPIAGCDCTGYRQQHTNGFWGDFGGVHIQANDYVVEVRNDDPANSSDSFSIMFSSGLNLDQQLPLVVNGVARTPGIFRVDLIGSSNLFSDSSLPANLDPTEFTLPFLFNRLGDTPSGLVDVLFAVNNLETVDVLRSDHDLDGDVDGADFLIWQRRVGSPAPNGDANSDNSVDRADLLSWATDFGMQPPSASPFGAIPEPSASVLEGLAFLMTWLARRFSARHS